MKRTLLIVTVLFFSVLLNAQDKIYTLDKKILEVKILEKTDKYVKYTYASSTSAILFTLKNNRIEKIEFSSGLVDYVGNQNPRKNKPFGISMSGYLGVYENETAGIAFVFDYFILPQIELEVAATTIYEEPTIMLGAKFHLNRNWSSKRITPFTGVMIDAGGSYFEIPIGLNYAGKSGFNMAVSVKSLKYNIADLTTYYDIFAEIKIGWRISLRG